MRHNLGKLVRYRERTLHTLHRHEYSKLENQQKHERAKHGYGETEIYFRSFTST